MSVFYLFVFGAFIDFFYNFKNCFTYRSFRIRVTLILFSSSICPLGSDSIEECCENCLSVIYLIISNSLIIHITNTVHSRQLCSAAASWKVGGSNKELVKDFWRGLVVIYCSLMDWTSNWTWIPNLKLLFSVNDIQSSSNKILRWAKLMKNNQKFGLVWASWPVSSQFLFLFNYFEWHLV